MDSGPALSLQAPLTLWVLSSWPRCPAQVWWDGLGAPAAPQLLALREHQPSWHLNVGVRSATCLSGHWPEHLRWLEWPGRQQARPDQQHCKPWSRAVWGIPRWVLPCRSIQHGGAKPSRPPLHAQPFSMEECALWPSDAWEGLSQCHEQVACLARTLLLCPASSGHDIYQEVSAPFLKCMGWGKAWSQESKFTAHWLVITAAKGDCCMFWVFTYVLEGI